MSGTGLPEHLAAGGPLTEDGGVGAIGEAVDGVDARQHLLHVVLVQLDGRPVTEKVVALLRAAVCPVRVGAPVLAQTSLQSEMKAHQYIQLGKLMPAA